MFAVIKNIAGWIAAYGPEAEAILAGLEKASELLVGEGKTGLPKIPSLQQIRDGLHYHRERTYLAELMSRTGKISYGDAVSMIAAGETATTMATPGAAGTFLANVLNWFNAEEPAIETAIENLAKLIIQVMTLLSASGI